MIEPESNAIYLIELCSGERRRWRYLGSKEDVRVCWCDLESGQAFDETSLMYAWRIIQKDDDQSTVNRGEVGE